MHTSAKGRFPLSAGIVWYMRLEVVTVNAVLMALGVPDPKRLRLPAVVAPLDRVRLFVVDEEVAGSAWQVSEGSELRIQSEVSPSCVWEHPEIGGRF